MQIMTRHVILTFLFAVLPLLTSNFADGFQSSTSYPLLKQHTRTSTQLYNLFGGQQKSKPKESNNSSNEPVVKNVLKVPTKSIKVRPLRFYLQLLFAGLQNTPVTGSWSLATNEENPDRLDMYYQDGSGMVSFSVIPDVGVNVDRHGQRPSLRFMLQESILLHSFLDELEQIAFGNEEEDENDDGKDAATNARKGFGKVEPKMKVDKAMAFDPEKRLLQFFDTDIISKIRALLPARPF